MSFVKETVADGAGADAEAHELFFGGKSQVFSGGSGGDDHRARLEGGGLVDHQGVPTARFGGEVGLGDHSPTYVRSKALCLILQVFHHGVAVHALRVARKVVHFGGGGQLTTGLQSHVHDGF